MRTDDAVPPRLTLEVEATNTGRRQVRFGIYVLERPWLGFLPWAALPPWRRVHSGRWTRDFMLEEGQQESLHFSIPQAALRAGRRFRIVDTLGRSWRGNATLKGTEAIKQSIVDPIEVLDLGIAGEPGAVNLGLYPPTIAGAHYRVQGRYYGPHQNRLRLSRFVDLATARKAFGLACQVAREFHEHSGQVTMPDHLETATSSFADNFED